MASMGKQKSSNLDKSLAKGKPEVTLVCYSTHINSITVRKPNPGNMAIISAVNMKVNVATYALLFSEIVQYCQNRVYTVPELQNKLAEMGQHVGSHLLDVLFLREKGYKREIKLLSMLIFIKSNFWKTVFGKEAEKLEQANDDERTYFIIEKEPLVNRYISVPKDKGSLNCAAFTAGMLEAVLSGANFPAKVTVHWHKGTCFMIKFDESVIARDKTIDGR